MGDVGVGLAVALTLLALLDDLVLRAVEMTIVIKLSRVVSTFLGGPLLFSWFQITFELSVIFTNDSLSWIIESIADIIGSLRDVFGSVDVVANECFAIWAKTLQLLRVESSILNRAIIPVLIFEL